MCIPPLRATRHDVTLSISVSARVFVLATPPLFSFTFFVLVSVRRVTDGQEYYLLDLSLGFLPFPSLSSIIFVLSTKIHLRKSAKINGHKLFPILFIC